MLCVAERLRYKGKEFETVRSKMVWSPYQEKIAITGIVVQAGYNAMVSLIDVSPVLLGATMLAIGILSARCEYEHLRTRQGVHILMPPLLLLVSVMVQMATVHWLMGQMLSLVTQPALRFIFAMLSIFARLLPACVLGLYTGRFLVWRQQPILPMQALAGPALPIASRLLVNHSPNLI